MNLYKLCLIFTLFSYPSFASEWKYNAQQEYDIYYESGEQSIYSNLYKNRYINMDQFIVEDRINKIKNSQNNIKFLDFGSGNGRHFSIYEKIASDLSNKELHLIAYDISKNAIESYKDLLIKKQYKLIENKTSESFFTEIYEKNNLKVTIIYPKKDFHIAKIVKHIGPVDITYCLYGVIAHIQGSKARSEAIQELFNNSKYDVLLSLPTYRILKDAREAFEYIRSNNIKIQIDNQDLVLEKSDLIYARNEGQKHVQNYYHVYESAHDMIDEIKHNISSKDVTIDVQVNKILHETTLVEYPILNMLDMYMSRGLSLLPNNSIKDNIARYYIITVSHSKNN